MPFSYLASARSVQLSVDLHDKVNLIISVYVCFYICFRFSQAKFTS